jgi:thiol-disulfide isomerase/thioredoxin
MKNLRTFAVLAAALAAGYVTNLLLVRAEEKKPAEEVALQVLDHDGLLELVKSHEGKVVVVDCWSTWCEPCVREFPGLVKLHEAHGKQVACISLCFDHDGVSDIETEIKPPVIEFLEKQGATFDNVLAADPDDSYRKLKFPAVPAVLVWDQQGKFVRLIHASTEGGDFTYEHVNKAVDELLAAGE